MSQHLLTKTYKAFSAIPAKTLVTIRNDGTVEAASGTNSMIIGITTDVATSANKACDVVHIGVATAIASTALGAGDILTSSADGRLVTTNTANHRAVGIALEPATAAGDEISVLISPSVL